MVSSSPTTATATISTAGVALITTAPAARTADPSSCGALQPVEAPRGAQHEHDRAGEQRHGEHVGVGHGHPR